MPRIAFLSDIHGNLPALEAVLREVDRCNPDLIVFGGDIVGYGASPAECVRLVRSLGGDCVLGNHEEMVTEIAWGGIESLTGDWRSNPVLAGLAHSLNTLSELDLKWIQKLPWFLPIDHETVIAHASLHDPQDWPYIDSQPIADLTLEKMKDRGLQTAFFGHIHKLACYPAIAPTGKDDFYVMPEGVNCAVTIGSVGQSREQDDRRATWVLWNHDERTLEFKRTEYDNQLAAKQIVDAGLPEFSARRLLPLLKSPENEL